MDTKELSKTDYDLILEAVTAKRAGKGDAGKSGVLQVRNDLQHRAVGGGFHEAPQSVPQEHEHPHDSLARASFVNAFTIASPESGGGTGANQCAPDGISAKLPIPQQPDKGSHPDKRAGNSQRQRILELLRDGNWHDSVEIQKVVYGGDHLGAANYKARINELRKQGHDIPDATKKAGSVYQYRLISEENQAIKEIARDIASG